MSEEEIEFTDLINYCFGDIKDELLKQKIEIKIFTDDNYMQIIRGINLTKRKLKTKEAVLNHFYETDESIDSYDRFLLRKDFKFKEFPTSN